MYFRKVAILQRIAILLSVPAQGSAEDRQYRGLTVGP
jgi:hypothetical protein